MIANVSRFAYAYPPHSMNNNLEFVGTSEVNNYIVRSYRDVIVVASNVTRRKSNS